MNTIEQKIAEVLGNPSFYEKLAGIEDPEMIIKAVQDQVPEASDDDIGKFIIAVSDKLEKETDNLSEEDLQGVAGGFAVTLTVAGVCTIVKAAAGAGALIGAAAWYWKNRKK